MNALRTLMLRVFVAIDEAKKEVIARDESKTDKVVLEDLVRSATKATALFVMAATGKNLLSLGLENRTVKPWARKIGAAVAVRHAVAAGSSGLVLWHRHHEEEMMLRAYEEEAALYA